MYIQCTFEIGCLVTLNPPQLVPAPSEIVLTARQRKRIRQTERKLNGAKRFAIEQEQARTAEIAVRRQGELQTFRGTSPEQRIPAPIPHSSTANPRRRQRQPPRVGLKRDRPQSPQGAQHPPGYTPYFSPPLTGSVLSHFSALPAQARSHPYRQPTYDPDPA